MTRTIGFVGAGNMADAMLRGLLRGNDFAPSRRRLAVAESLADALADALAPLAAQ